MRTGRNRPGEMREMLCCAMTPFVSGYAFQTLSFSMPGLVHDWKLDGALIEPLPSSGIFGLLLGYISLRRWPIGWASGR